MGRVTIFTADDCDNCSRIKHAFKLRDIPFIEISLTTYPKRRKDMLSLCERLSVPQVFLNGTHIGGAEETMAVLERWDKDMSYPTPLDRYRHKVALRKGPTDPRLALPPNLAVTPRRPRKRAAKVATVDLCDGSSKLATVYAVTTFLIKVMPRADLCRRAKVYKNCFTGRDGVRALKKFFKLNDVEEAVSLGRSFQRKQLLHHVTCDHVFGDNDYYFRLQPYQQPKILNSFRVWDEKVDPDSMLLLGRLQKLLGNILSAATDDRGLPDYVAAGDDPEFLVFDEAVCELQGVNLCDMGNCIRLAFGINLYNLMIKHAYIKIGVPRNSIERSTFFRKVSYNIGGDLLSLDELEHGVLRANRNAPHSRSAPFAKDDSRARLALSKVEPRIHFALNCGTKSCPPPNNFTAECIDEELRIVAEAFCDQDYNVSIDTKNAKLTLPMIFSWYRSDFAQSSSTLPEALLSYLRGKKKEKLMKMLESGEKIEVKFRSYEWSILALNSRPFHCSKLKGHEFKLQ